MEQEIIHLHIGRCGHRLGEHFWTRLLAEHGLDKDGISRRDVNGDVSQIGVNFSCNSNRYLPRAILVDTKRESIDSVCSGPLRGLIRPNNRIVADWGTQNNWGGK
eukprot:TRINITY_DN6271_c0_g1_i1.p1 TRINITY_DN6271_c0_g1~~TRINITY_DN6271_c0_g1_i1.p1  ORF type:complete len:105 (-),score=9.78 TRINITY_DN6271_c0_g1_i1:134-448(-)